MSFMIDDRNHVGNKDPFWFFCPLELYIIFVRMKVPVFLVSSTDVVIIEMLLYKTSYHRKWLTETKTTLMIEMWLCIFMDIQNGSRIFSAVHFMIWRNMCKTYIPRLYKSFPFNRIEFSLHEIWKNACIIDQNKSTIFLHITIR